MTDSNPKRPTEAEIDEAVKGTFPASDPVALHGETRASAGAQSTSGDPASSTKHAPAIPTHQPVQEPEPDFPSQHLDRPGLESQLDPQPRWRGQRYQAADKLQGQVALVTGGDSGIGRSVAYHFAREGADVAITCLPDEAEDADDVRDAIIQLGRRCVVFKGDLRSVEFCREAVEGCIRELGPLNILVHNAGWQTRKRITELTEEELDTTMKVNVYAFLRLARIAVPHLKPGSVILATGSIVGLQGAERMSDYGATKGAIHAIVRCLAEELREQAIRVNCVAPGPVWTPLNPSDAGLTEQEVATFGRKAGKSPMGRPAQPEELAPAYVFLASNADSSYINGIVLPVTAGPAK